MHIFYSKREVGHRAKSCPFKSMAHKYNMNKHPKWIKQYMRERKKKKNQIKEMARRVKLGRMHATLSSE
jgi:hypothetical protein